jgi:hypothetical protein
MGINNGSYVVIVHPFYVYILQDLINELKSELSGNLEDCLLAMMEPKVLYDAKCLRRGMRVRPPPLNS